MICIKEGRFMNKVDVSSNRPEVTVENQNPAFSSQNSTGDGIQFPNQEKINNTQGKNKTRNCQTNFQINSNEPNSLAVMQDQTNNKDTEEVKAHIFSESLI
jgi:hypothetical protein